MLSAPVYEPINVHYSVLPKHRGASPIQSTILQVTQGWNINNENDKGLMRVQFIKSLKLILKNQIKKSLNTNYQSSQLKILQVFYLK